MYKILILLFVGIVGCSHVEESRLKATVDSLQVVTDSLKVELKQQRVLARFTAEKCHRYAVIVRNNPSQSVFIVNWIDRSFLWLNEK
jgi:hypothetical protein